MEKHFTSTGFITNLDGTKVLMVFHKKLGKWAIPGGHLEKDELPEDGAKREVFEETGVKVKMFFKTGYNARLNDEFAETSLANPFMMLREYIPEKGDKPAHLHMDFIFLGVADDTLPLVGQEEEVENVKWVEFKDVLEMDTFGSVRKIAEEILKAGSFDHFLLGLIL